MLDQRSDSKGFEQLETWYCTARAGAAEAAGAGLRAYPRDAGAAGGGERPRQRQD